MIDTSDRRRQSEQLGSWSINRTQGDVVKREASKKRLLAETYGHWEDCRRAFDRAAPQMHRLDHTPAHDRAPLGVRSRDDAEECEGPADEGESPKANAVMPAMVAPVVWCHSSICVDAAR